MRTTLHSVRFPVLKKSTHIAILLEVKAKSMQIQRTLKTFLLNLWTVFSVSEALNMPLIFISGKRKYYS